MKVIVISAKAQHGKDTVANIFKSIAESYGERVLITHYADYLKYICKEWFNWDGKKDDNGRNILQRVGTNLARSNNPDIWVNVVIESLKAFGSEYDYVLIPDCRFPNEVDAMKDSFPTISLRIERIDFESDLNDEQKSHLSEIALDNYNFDYTIETISDMKYLKSKVKEFYDWNEVVG
jgi:hypothetical protein